MELNYYGIFIGIILLIFTALGHIIVIKGEYHFGVKIWPVFLLVGIISLLLSLLIDNDLLSGMFGIIGIIFLWGIKELFQQKERVKKGWFPSKNKK